MSNGDDFTSALDVRQSFSPGLMVASSTVGVDGTRPCSTGESRKDIAACVRGTLIMDEEEVK